MFLFFIIVLVFILFFLIFNLIFKIIYKKKYIINIRLEKIKFVGSKRSGK